MDSTTELRIRISKFEDTAIESIQLEEHRDKILTKMTTDLKYSNMHVIGISKEEI